MVALKVARHGAPDPLRPASSAYPLSRLERRVCYTFIPIVEFPLHLGHVVAGVTVTGCAVWVLGDMGTDSPD